jgi:thiol-disulfide isomerase/thioredoxin
MKIIFSTLFLCISMVLFGQKTGYEIKVKLNNYDEKKLVLGYHYADKQYIKDTVEVGTDGYFTFKGDKALDGGMYLLITMPDKQFFQVLVSQGEQHFTVQTDAKTPIESFKVKGSADNQLFYDYMQWLGKKREEADKTRAEIKKDSANVKKVADLTKKLEGFDKEVKDYQMNLINKNKGTLTAAILWASLDVEVPKFEGSDEDVQNKRYFWYKAHFFDHFDFADPRLIRTNVLHNRTDYYLTKLVVQHPDSINLGIDEVLKLAKKNPDTYKYYLVTLLNNYAKSNFVGQDACYVHIARNYYEKGECSSWIEKEELSKIIKNAKDLEPTLLGKVGQDLMLEKEDGSKVRLYDLKTDYTILLFWSPECGHCKKEMPDFIEFYKKWKSKGTVSMIAVCNKVQDGVPECWKYIKETPGMDWLNVVDTYLLSDYVSKYYVKATPQLYVLDKDKKIVMKKIEAKQLDNVMNEIIRMDAEKIKQGK